MVTGIVAAHADAGIDYAYHFLKSSISDTLSGTLGARSSELHPYPGTPEEESNSGSDWMVVLKEHLDAFATIASALHVTDKEQAEILGFDALFPEILYERALILAHDRTTDAVAWIYIIDMFCDMTIYLSDKFGGEMTSQRRWLRTPLIDLDGRTPVDVMCEFDPRNLRRIATILRRDYCRKHPRIATEAL